MKECRQCGHKWDAETSGYRTNCPHCGAEVKEKRQEPAAAAAKE